MPEDDCLRTADTKQIGHFAGRVDVGLVVYAVKLASRCQLESVRGSPIKALAQVLVRHYPVVVIEKS